MKYKNIFILFVILFYGIVTRALFAVQFNTLAEIELHQWASDISDYHFGKTGFIYGLSFDQRKVFIFNKTGDLFREVNIVQNPPFKEKPVRVDLTGFTMDGTDHMFIAARWVNSGANVYSDIIVLNGYGDFERLLGLNGFMAHDIAANSSGKIIVAGYSSENNSDNYMLRELNSDGETVNAYFQSRDLSLTKRMMILSSGKIIPENRGNRVYFIHYSNQNKNSLSPKSRDLANKIRNSVGVPPEFPILSFKRSDSLEKNIEIPDLSTTRRFDSNEEDRQIPAPSRKRPYEIQSTIVTATQLSSGFMLVQSAFTENHYNNDTQQMECDEPLLLLSILNKDGISVESPINTKDLNLGLLAGRDIHDNLYFLKWNEDKKSMSIIKAEMIL